MAFLKVVQGSCPGQIVELRGERTVVGRHPSCEIVLDNAAVSRHHAQILESHGQFYLEDLRSRNRTFLNGTPIEGRTLLHDGDALGICNIVFRFHVRGPAAGAAFDTAEEVSGLPAPAGGNDAITLRSPVRGATEILPAAAADGQGAADESSIISTLDVVSSSEAVRLSIKPEAKLRAVLEIGNAVARVLDLDEILRKVLDGLFNIFPQADAGFVLFKDPETGRLRPRVSKLRHEGGESGLRISRTVVEQALETREAILSADAVRDQRFSMSDSLSELRIRSMMCVPLLNADGEALGVIQIDTQKLKEQFSRDDLDVLVSVASQVGLAVQNARLHESLLQQRELQRDLELATQIQLGFLPNQRPRVEGYEFFDYYEAAQSIGGDYFDYVPLPDGRVALSIADVAGKGIAAALLMARLYSAARSHLLMRGAAADAMASLNAELSSSGLGFRFITCVLAILDPGRHELTIANAGHFPPLLRSAGGRVKQLARKIAGMPLGVVPDQKFEQATIGLEPDDAVLLFTDGITEAMNDRQEMYGSKLLSKYLTRASGSAEELVKGLVADVDQFADGTPQRDDICLVSLRRLGSAFGRPQSERRGLSPQAGPRG